MQEKFIQDFKDFLKQHNATFVVTDDNDGNPCAVIEFYEQQDGEGNVINPYSYFELPGYIIP